MALVFGKLRCCFCNSKKGFIHSICDYGSYGEVGRRLHYHPECLELVQMYPEAYGHRAVDQALNIIDLKKKAMEFNKDIISDYEKKLESLRTSHFENMMPKV